MDRNIETMLIFYCYHCEKELRTPMQHAGKKARCTRCKQKTNIPDIAILLDDEFSRLPIIRKVS